MELNDYQLTAQRTRQQPHETGAENMVPLLGLAGEVGELLNEYKKYLRDGEAHTRFKDRVIEELGDILWYTAATASQFGLALEDVARANVAKVNARWASGEQSLLPAHDFDSGFPDGERLPRQLIADFRQIVEGKSLKTRVFVNGVQMGQDLTDNAHQPDGYRFHDVFHLACAAVLGWSPVTRRNLSLKRRSQTAVDEVEDGGRAIVIEEGISALVFAYAADHKALQGVRSVDYQLLKAIRIMTSGLEVGICTTGEWERTILMGYDVWKRVEEQQGGKVRLDLDARTISFQGMA